uniref:Uncharacterized protein n=1 Tax=Hyaloperonospora arabidopsidis (strain Emoy2) TaxID=559515 RepID=M4BTM3_HYAAE
MSDRMALNITSIKRDLVAVLSHELHELRQIVVFHTREKLFIQRHWLWLWRGSKSVSRKTRMVRTVTVVMVCCF